jgi:hypothetical protein
MSKTYVNEKAVGLRRLLASGSLIMVLVVSVGGIASAAVSSSNANNTSVTGQDRVKTIITKGDQEISRRQTALGKLNTKISSATKLTPNDKSVLTTQVTTEISGLTNLKTKLDADTDLATTKSDAQSIISEYRVYALVVPKVALIKVADDQQATESKLTALATKLQTAITAKQTAGKDVASLQTQLADMTTKTAAASAISTSIESGVISLQPSDYDSNHSVLTGDNTQLKSAHADNQAAYADAKAIAAALKSL